MTCNAKHAINLFVMFMRVVTTRHAVEETSNAMALDGIMFEGVSVRVRR